MNTADLANLLPWGEPKRVPTTRGERMLYSVRLKAGNPQHDAFLARWRAEAKALRAAGVTVGEWPKGSGKMEACWWRELDAATLATERAAIEASRATDADVDIPAPEGLSYLPFQKAGIAFVLQRFGDSH